MDAQQRLAEAIEHGRAGRKPQARAILSQLVKEDPQFADAWLWLSACFDEQERRVYCLNKALEIDPLHARARQALQKLGAGPTPFPAAPAPPEPAPAPTATSSAAQPASTAWISDFDHESQLAAPASEKWRAEEQEPDRSHGRRYTWYQVWITVAVFGDEDNIYNILNDPKAKPSRGYAWLFAASLVSFIAGVLLFSGRIPDLLAALPSMTATSIEIPLDARNLMGNILIGMIVASPIFAGLGVLGVVLSAGVYQIVAKLMGGHGTFSEMVYILCALYTPLYLVGTLINFVPAPGSVLLGVIAGMYSIFISLKAIKAVNRFSWGSAIITLLAPGLVFGIIGCLCSLLVNAMAPGLTGVSPDLLPYP